MKPGPVVPVALQRDAQGVAWSAEYADIYHPHIGPQAQARHVFLHGNGLPRRWQRRERFVILETGFGLGNNFLATWQAWRDDPARCERLQFVSIEKHPLRRADLAVAHRSVAADAPPAALSEQLIAAWPALTPNLHRLAFEGERVELFLALGDVQDWLPELRLRADAFYLDGFAPARNPRMWDRRVCMALGRLAAPEATLATWSAASALRDDLTTAGFVVRQAQGIGGKRDITLATFAPRFQPAASKVATDGSAPPHERRALVIGAGLAGCASAWALAGQGWSVRVLEREPRLAAQASGNPAGLFHGIVHADDGPHARLHRAASFEARQAVRHAIDTQGVAGNVGGLLRIEHRLTPQAMQAQLAALGLPADYVDVLDTDATHRHAGIALRATAAWHYPGGGWVDPAGLCAAFAARAGSALAFEYGAEVHALSRLGSQWQALDRSGRVIDSAPVLVIASAVDAARLLPPGMLALRAVRGQLSWLDAGRDPGAAQRLTAQLPIADAGYLLPPSRGIVAFGATSHEGDADPSVRLQDHAANLAKLDRLLGRPSGLDAAQLGGRTSWRCVAGDRLPLIGAVPAIDGFASDLHARRDLLGSLPREAGLFVFTALGSRGITWAALGARVLAAAIAGGVAPLESSLLAAVDPARFALRTARRASGSAQG